MRFFVVASIALASAGGITTSLIQHARAIPPLTHARIPGAFWCSTLLLAAGSLSLHLAVQYVRREKQRKLLACLWAGVASGTLFVGVQGYGLWLLTGAYREGIPPGSDELVAGEFGVVFAGLHAAHFIVALLFVIYTTVHAVSHRYDHEYYWGITFCAWFWHALGVVWGVIFGILILITLFVTGPTVDSGCSRSFGVRSDARSGTRVEFRPPTASGLRKSTRLPLHFGGATD